jgi:phosphoribosylformylglycinamidine cyclo-ligase
MPELIKYICDLAGLSQEEALRTFNCGIGFALIIAEEDAPLLRKMLSAEDEAYFEIGHIEDAQEGTGRSVRYC